MSVSSRASASLMGRHALRICSLAAVLSATLVVAHGPATARLVERCPPAGTPAMHSLSARMFDRTDTNKDGVITQNDPPPVREPRTDERAVTSQMKTP